MTKHSYDSLRGNSRRDFIRGVFAASAALGVGPLRALQVLDQTGGSALAQEACMATARVVNVVAGTGGFAWFSLLWPPHRVVGAGFAMSNVLGNNVATITAGNGDIPTNQPLYAWKVNGQPLFNKYKRDTKVTAVVAGRAFAHQIAPSIANNTNTISDGVGGDLSAFAAMAALQSGLPVLLPVIGVQFNGVDMPYRPTVRPVPEAPAQASVLRSSTGGSADGIIGLFSSAAAQVVGRLGTDPVTKKTNAPLFAQYYRAFQSLSRTALRPTYQATTRAEQLALKVVSTNMASALDYKTGVDNTTALDLATVVGSQVVSMAQSNNTSARMVLDLARALIVTYKAFKEGLTAQINLPAFNDDPHNAFANGTAGPIANGLAMLLDWFMGQCASTPDPLCPGKTLADNLVMTFSGDMPKSPFSSNDDWNDSPPNSANWIYIVHNGELKPGWFGNVEPGKKRAWDPVANKPTENSQDQGVLERPLNSAALAGALLAVAKGNQALVRPLFTGNYKFLIA